MWFVIFPRWVMIIMYIEYRAVVTMLIPVRIIEELDQLNKDVMIMSSPIRLIDGGSARLARLAKNHHVAIRGKIICRPRARVIVRLCVRS